MHSDNSMIKIAAISDLHITDTSCPEWQVLMHFLDSPQVASATHLYLLGDIFDLLIGGHQFYAEKFSQFFSRIRDLAAKGKIISYFEGNHDFAFEKLFKNIHNVTIYRDGQLLLANGSSYYFCHGDHLETSNYSYLIYTKFIRSKMMRTLINLVPSFAIQWIGRHSSRYSRKKGDRKVKIIGAHARKDRFIADVTKFLSKNQINIMVCGHSHFSAELKILDAHYLNPGRSGHTKKFVWIEGKKAELLTLQSDSST